MTALVGSYPCRGFQLTKTTHASGIEIARAPWPLPLPKVPNIDTTLLFTRHKLDRAPAEGSSLPYSSRFLAHLFSTERCVHTAVCALLISLRHRTIWALLVPASADPTHSRIHTLLNPNLIMSVTFETTIYAHKTAHTLLPICSAHNDAGTLT